MSGVSWEREVANYLEEKGYRTKLRETIKGHEMDIYAIKGNDALVVECKDWNSSVSPDSIRRCKKVAEDVSGKPAIAYTSKLSPGAENLAKRWSFIKLSSGIVRGDVLSLKDVKDEVEKNELCLLNEDDLSRLGDALGPFVPDKNFAEQVIQAAHQLMIGSPSKSDKWLKERINDLTSENREANVCVPLLRHDEFRINLYFIDLDTHDALPEKIEKEKLELS